MSKVQFIQEGLNSVLKKVGVVSYPAWYLSKIPLWLQTKEKSLKLCTQPYLHAFSHSTVVFQESDTHIIFNLLTFSLEFVFLSPEKWYLNLFLSGERSNSSGRTIGSPKLVFLNPSRGVFDDHLVSSSFNNRLKSFMNFFSCFFQISACLEETAEDTNGHLISFKINEKSLQWEEVITYHGAICACYLHEAYYRENLVHTKIAQSHDYAIYLAHNIFIHCTC